MIMAQRWGTLRNMNMGDRNEVVIMPVALLLHLFVHCYSRSLPSTIYKLDALFFWYRFLYQVHR